MGPVGVVIAAWSLLAFGLFDLVHCESESKSSTSTSRRSIDDVQPAEGRSSAFSDQIAQKAKQTVADFGQVMKAEQSVLECDGKKCPNNNIFVFYQCCDDIAEGCCWHVRYWLTIVFVLILLKLLWSFLVWCVRSLCRD